ncbi:MAG: nucleotidyltransferase domain-containing protein [Candidatus Marinimicrobia bacterium]|nr:nucleotidyltransferase domain-containing protein [Candidatus Neomarinimicrobiota bacterium]
MINIEKLKPEIVERLKPLKPDKIILFGSYANGTATEDSDIDLYVVTNDDYMPKNYDENMQVYLKVASQIQDILQKYPTDLITHTKKMHEKFVKLNSFFSQEMLSKGVSLL